MNHVKAPSECDHLRKEVRRKANAAGHFMYREQCLDCGRAASQQIRREKVAAIWSVREWDEQLEQRGDEEQKQYYERQRIAYLCKSAAERDEWFRQHNEYLRSPQWRNKRDRVLKRDNHTCQACLLRPATQVHHKTYEHWRNEPLFELESICDVCHEAITKLDRERRAAS